jgi:hypothetical protein|nr:MAG TPA: hypothetical protein [Caudoviricetes sp.]
MTKQNRKPYFVISSKLDYTQKKNFSGHFFIKENLTLEIDYLFESDFFTKYEFV